MAISYKKVVGRSLLLKQWKVNKTVFIIDGQEYSRKSLKRALEVLIYLRIPWNQTKLTYASVMFWNNNIQKKRHPQLDWFIYIYLYSHTAKYNGTEKNNFNKKIFANPLKYKNFVQFDASYFPVKNQAYSSKRRKRVM
jgi:hypoxanthine phosphoribosyltransferase